MLLTNFLKCYIIASHVIEYKKKIKTFINYMDINKQKGKVNRQKERRSYRVLGSGIIVREERKIIL